MTDAVSFKPSAGFSSGRRLFLLGAVGGLFVAGVAGTASMRSGNESRVRWLKSTIRRHLPGVTIDDVSLTQFANEIVAAGMVQSTARKMSIGLAEAAPWAATSLPFVSAGLQKLERLVLTEFLLGSDFFRIDDPRAQIVTYYGRAVACANPFARAA